MAVVRRKKDDTLEQMIKRFRRKYQDDGIAQELKKREYYLSPSQKRKRKSEAAQARLRKKNKNYIILDL